MSASLQAVWGMKKPKVSVKGRLHAISDLVPNRHTYPLTSVRHSAPTLEEMLIASGFDRVKSNGVVVYEGLLWG